MQRVRRLLMICRLGLADDWKLNQHLLFTHPGTGDITLYGFIYRLNELGNC